MSITLGCIADDYTGASDLANTLTKCGLRTVQTIGVPAADLALPDVDAVVVALKSRSCAKDDAVTWSRRGERLAARARRDACAVQDLLDLRFDEGRQHRPRRRGTAGGKRRHDRAGDAGVSGDRPHGLPGQPVRRRRAAERKPAEGSSAQSDARCEPGAGAGRAEPFEGRPRQSRERRQGCGRDPHKTCRAGRRGREDGDHRCGVRSRSRNHRPRRAGSSALGRRVRHRPRPGAGACDDGPRARDAVPDHRSARRSAARPRASPAAARRRRWHRSRAPRLRCRCCGSIRRR